VLKSAKPKKSLDSSGFSALENHVKKREKISGKQDVYQQEQKILKT
jgi:hypothetical protein